MNVQHSLLQKRMLYEFKLCRNVMETIKNICCVKRESTVDHITVIRWFKKFSLGCKNLHDQARPGRAQTIDSKAILQTIEANMASSTWRVSGKLDISQFSVIHHLHNLGKSIKNCQIVSCVNQNIIKLLTPLVYINAV